MTELPLSNLSGFAVDLGGTKIAAARIRSGRIEEVIVQQTDAKAGPEQMLTDLSNMARQVGFEKDQPIGVAVAGSLDADGLWSAVNTSIFDGLGAFPLVQHLGRQFGAGVAALNDTRAAVIGEHRYGAGQGARSLAYLTVSTGISAGFVLNGMPLESPNGLLGHVGFLPSRYGQGVCGSGRLATYETVASGRAIEARAKERGHPTSSCKDIFAHADAGIGWAQELVNDSSVAIAELCASLAAAIGVERIVLGGGVGLAGGYVGRVQQHLRSEPHKFRPEVVPATLGQNSGLVGALSHAIEANLPG